MRLPAETRMRCHHRHGLPHALIRCARALAMHAPSHVPLLPSVDEWHGLCHELMSFVGAVGQYRRQPAAAIHTPSAWALPRAHELGGSPGQSLSPAVHCCCHPSIHHWRGPHFLFELIWSTACFHMRSPNTVMLSPEAICMARAKATGNGLCAQLSSDSAPDWQPSMAIQTMLYPCCHLQCLLFRLLCII